MSAFALSLVSEEYELACQVLEAVAGDHCYYFDSEGIDANLSINEINNKIKQKNEEQYIQSTEKRCMGITLDFLLQADRFVHLFESPAFTRTRMKLIGPINEGYEMNGEFDYYQEDQQQGNDDEEEVFDEEDDDEEDQC
ncbi:MAG: hypothetical protein EZS28_036291, partial [Streblomastix strix]